MVAKNKVSQQMGNFLRLKREAIHPKDRNLKSSGRRRTPGLRREEVAELSGISVDWYIRLEQGRDSFPSKDAALRIAQVLGLNPAERSHLLRLARGQFSRVFKKESVPPAIIALLRDLSQPAYILGARFDVLYGNAAAAEYFPFFADAPESVKNNLLYQMFASPRANTLFVHWAKEARDILESFRADYDVWANSPEFTQLVEITQRMSPEFKKWWKTHTIKPRTSGEKLLRHPNRGLIKMGYSFFSLSENPGLKLVLYGLPEQN